MKILIVGGSGVIGFYSFKSFVNENSEINYTYYKNKTPYPRGIHLDVRDRTNTIEILKKLHPDFVIISNASL